MKKEINITIWMFLVMFSFGLPLIWDSQWSFLLIYTGFLWAPLLAKYMKG